MEKLDLRGISCPLNYVKAKLKFEELREGQEVELWLDDGDPVVNVPRSAKEDGHKIVAVSRDDSYFKVVIKKG